MPNPTPATTETPSNLDTLLRSELDAVQAACEKHGGKAALARFLGIRPSEISRYFTDSPEYGRTPSAKILAGMREFLRQQTPPEPPKKAVKKVARKQK